jgi:hypothetical protein
MAVLDKYMVAQLCQVPAARYQPSHYRELSQLFKGSSVKHLIAVQGQRILHICVRQMIQSYSHTNYLCRLAVLVPIALAPTFPAGKAQFAPPSWSSISLSSHHEVKKSAHVLLLHPPEVVTAHALCIKYTACGLLVTNIWPAACLRHLKVMC